MKSVKSLWQSVEPNERSGLVTFVVIFTAIMLLSAGIQVGSLINSFI